MITVYDVYEAIDRFAPFSTQLDFDNSGLLVGDKNAPVTKVAVALDPTAAALRQADELGCQLLVTHHPIIFDPLKRLMPDDPAYIAAAKGIAVICAHTNLDAASSGVNDTLAGLIGLTESAPLPGKDFINPMARIGRLGAVSADSLAVHVKSAIGCARVKYVPCDGHIKKVAVCAGSGGDLIVDAYEAGADALVTGESRHHERLMAERLGIALLECGHFATEQAVRNVLSSIIERLGVQSVILDQSDPARYI